VWKLRERIWQETSLEWLNLDHRIKSCSWHVNVVWCGPRWTSEQMKCWEHDRGLYNDLVVTAPSLTWICATVITQFEDTSSFKEPSTRWFIISYYCVTNTNQGWLGSRVVSVLDSGAVEPGFKSQSPRCWVTAVLGKLFTPIGASVHQAAKLVAGLAESNGSLLPGLWLKSPAGWLPRIGISFGKPVWAISWTRPVVWGAARVAYSVTSGGDLG